MSYHLLSVVTSEIGIPPHLSAYIVQYQRSPYGRPDISSMANSDVSFVLAEKFLDGLSFTDSRDMTKESGAIFPSNSCSMNVCI